jgi:hypothetical protein
MRKCHNNQPYPIAQSLLSTPGASANASPRTPKTDHESGDSASDTPTVDRDFAAALLMIERLPLSDEQKAEAVRRLLNTCQG